MPIVFVLFLSVFVFLPVIAARLLLALFALKLGAQPLTVGLIASTFSFFPMVLSVVAGKLADRFGSRWIILASTVAGACGMLVPYFMPGIPALFIAASTNGIAFAFYAVSLQNDVGLLSTPANRAQSFSNFSLTGSVVIFTGPLMVGYSIDHAGAAITCMYIAVLSLIPMAMLVIGGGVLPGGRRSAAAPAGSFRETLSDRGLWKLMVTSSLAISGMDLFQFYMPVYGHQLGFSASAIGFLMAMFAVAGFFVRVILSRLIVALKEDKVLAYSFYVSAASFLLIPFFKTMAPLAVLSFVFGIGFGCANPIITMLMFTRSAAGRSGEAMGLRMTANHLTRSVAPAVFGSLGSAFGLFPVFWINALMLAAGGVLSRVKRGL